MLTLTKLSTQYYIREYPKYYELDLQDDVKLRFNDDYYYCESDTLHLDKVNIILSKMTITDISDIVKLLKEHTSKNELSTNAEYIDTMNLFVQSNKPTKYKLDKHVLYSKFNSSTKGMQKNSNIPKELQLTPEQVYNIIIQEIEKVNQNMEHNHYISCTDNPYNPSIHFVYKDGELGDKMKIINSKYGYNYFELKFNLNPSMYPFLPPKVEYVKPKIDVNLVNNILNLELWDIKTWNYTISLDWLVKNLGESLKEHFNNYLDLTLTNENGTFTKIESKLLLLGQKTKETTFKKIDINIEFNKLSQSSQTKAAYWNAGVGYGTGNQRNSEWDISTYINNCKNETEDIIYILDDLKNHIKYSDEDISVIFDSVLCNYIIKQLFGTTLLEFNKKIKLYKTIINILKILSDKNPPQEFINKIYLAGVDMRNEINTITSNYENAKALAEDDLDTYLLFISVFEYYSSEYKNNNELVSPTSTSDMNNYINMINENKFGNFIFDHEHLYFKNGTTNLGQKTILRIVSEISSLKKNLPVNWDTSIILRVSQDKINVLSFIIVGPKDTPYHNGLFEFHAYFPDKYPKVVPQVLLKTTGGERVRFNPNLYNNGKVCLSLLGTWSGEKGESWNSDISTFLQVLISIQSLILVEHPYFNEPGWEREMHTKSGKLKSFEYSDNIRLETIKLGMIDMIKNSPQSYEEFIKQHFIMKQKEIYETIEKWIEETIDRKKDMTKAYNELQKLINDYEGTHNKIE